ncbi:MAG TPA: ABC transporter substrate-binding protein [Clostridiaceae bacterium]|nr:ABC transporter substrate-binding protein [Clostridiaceae bacterium]
MNLLLASGDIPDRFCPRMNSIYKMVEQDVMAELSEELLRKFMPNKIAAMEALEPKIIEYSKIDGKLYGLRAYEANYRYRSTMVWNMQWLRNLGYDKIPETLDEAEEVFYRFANDDPDKDGVKDTYAFSREGLFAIFGSYGIFPGGNKFMPFDHWVERDGKLVNSVTTPEMKIVLAKLAKWYKDGLIDPEWLTGEHRGGANSVSYSFIEGRIGMTNMGTYYHWMPAYAEGTYQGMNYTELYKIYGEETKNILGFSGALKVPGYNSALPSNNEISNVMESFGKHLEKEPDKLGKLLQICEYFSDKENVVTVYKGIEGKHWKVNDQGIVVSIGKYADVAEQAKIGAHCTFTHHIDPDVLHTKINVGYAEFAKSIGCDKDILRNQLKMPLKSASKYQSELDRLRDEMIVAIVTGDKPVDYFDEFVKIYNEAGGDELTKEANEWYQSIKK